MRANSSAGRALALQARGHRFEPCFAHQWHERQVVKGMGNKKAWERVAGSGTKRSRLLTHQVVPKPERSHEFHVTRHSKNNLDTTRTRPLDFSSVLESLDSAWDKPVMELELKARTEDMKSSKGGGSQPDLIARN